MRGSWARVIYDYSTGNTTGWFVYLMEISWYLNLPPLDRLVRSSTENFCRLAAVVESGTAEFNVTPGATMERENVETVNPDSILHARLRCAPSLGVMIPPLTPVQEPPQPNRRFHFSFLLTGARMRRDCMCCDFNWPPPSLTYLSQIPLSPILYSSQTALPNW